MRRGGYAAPASTERPAAVQLPTRVDGGPERVELERELLRIGLGVELAALDRCARVVAEQSSPARQLGGDGVAHRTGTAVHLDRRVGKEAAARERAALHIVEPAVEHRLQPRDAGLVALLRVAYDTVDEDRGGRTNGRDLQLLLGAEVREQAALAHLELGREPADREAL
jgi:hypothetical protein